MTATTDPEAALCSQRVAEAAVRMYEAEGALHAARQAGSDAWIAAAYDRLHEAIEAHSAALEGKLP